MATVVGTQVWNAKRVSTTTWTPLLNGDSGSAESVGRLSDRSIQIKGTFGVGGNVIIEGSNDSITWATLRDAGNSLLGTITAADIREILENTLFVRPRVSAGDGTTSLTVILTAASTA